MDRGLIVIERRSVFDCASIVDGHETLRELIVVERTGDGIFSARQEVTINADMGSLCMEQGQRLSMVLRYGVDE